MDQITKDFPGGRVLHGVDFAVQPGEVHALVGENGAGKSTLMKILAGLYPDYGGEIAVAGDLVSMTSPRKALDEGIAVIYQEFALAPDLTVGENIALGREPSLGVPGSISHRKLTRRSAEDAKSLGIDLPIDTPVGLLGVGDQQLTEIVKAVSRKARVLVMDEPTARLSSEERDRLFSIIRGLADRGVAIVYISHFLEEIFSVATRVTVLRDGHLVASQPLADLTVHELARLMVGDKFREIEISARQNLESTDIDREVALVVDGLTVDGVFDPVDFTLHRGEVLGFAGLQGSGRTDLARAIVGESESRRRGRIETKTFRGLPNSPKKALSAGILMLPANRKTEGILSTRPIAENVAVAALSRGLSRFGFVRTRLRRQRVADLMDRFAVRPRDPRVEISALSGGNQQKALFARATAADAAVLILDQPTAGVDVGATVELYDQVDALTKSGVSVILISDDLTELLRLSDRIVLMKEGRAGEPRLAGEYDRASLLAAITGDAPSEEIE
ncbi:hypothetical protein BOH66_06315 [Microbacterium aurum]|uniref:ABC transporter domain-containing protein n=1 Tax=Microbacterium aurum TaxID=36805 RepID=A0A1P8U767_9MICO|nr:sugar ABC transporter ATP-binding protein [Microbacterium aurum]APZ33913.1 hypothetical protein BOH66_06315 [Microbacterium aurum]MBM7827674.1 ABC-type sugar transport system ATPase subunit [Microbacterium aurum]